MFDTGLAQFGSPRGERDGSRALTRGPKPASTPASTAAAAAAASPVGASPAAAGVAAATAASPAGGAGGVAAAVSGLVQACNALRQAVAQNTDPGAAVTVLPELTCQGTVLEAVRLELVRRLAQSDVWAGSGAASAGAWLRRETPWVQVVVATP